MESPKLNLEPSTEPALRQRSDEVNASLQRHLAAVRTADEMAEQQECREALVRALDKVRGSRV